MEGRGLGEKWKAAQLMFDWSENIESPEATLKTSNTLPGEAQHILCRKSRAIILLSLQMEERWNLMMALLVDDLVPNDLVVSS